MKKTFGEIHFSWGNHTWFPPGLEPNKRSFKKNHKSLFCVLCCWRSGAWETEGIRTWLWQRVELCSSVNHCSPMDWSQRCVFGRPDVTGNSQWTLQKRDHQREGQWSLSRGNLWKDGLLRIKDLRGSHKQPTRHLSQGATRERYRVNESLGTARW